MEAQALTRASIVGSDLPTEPLSTGVSPTPHPSRRGLIFAESLEFGRYLLRALVDEGGTAHDIFGVPLP